MKPGCMGLITKPNLVKRMVSSMELLELLGAVSGAKPRENLVESAPAEIDTLGIASDQVYRIAAYLVAFHFPNLW